MSKNCSNIIIDFVKIKKQKCNSSKSLIVESDNLAYPTFGIFALHRQPHITSNLRNTGGLH